MEGICVTGMRQDENYVYIELWGETFQYNKIEYALYRLSEELEAKIISDAQRLTQNRINGKVLDVKENGPIGEGHETTYQVLPWVWENVDIVASIIEKSGVFIHAELKKYGINLTPNWKHINSSWLEQVEKVKKILGEAMSNAFTSTAQNIANKYQAAYNEELSKDYGLNFGIISNSLTAHLLYAAQATSKEMKDKERATQFASQVTGNPMEQILLNQFDILYPLYMDSAEPALLKVLSEYYAYVVSLFAKELSYPFDDVTQKFNIDKSNQCLLSSLNPRDSILNAIKIYPNNGNVIGFAILNGVLDEQLCEYGCNASSKFDSLVNIWATDYLCNVYEEGKLFNKPLVNEQNKDVIAGLITYCDKREKQLEKNILWQEIVENVYLESIISTSEKFQEIASSLTDKGIFQLAKARRKISIISSQRTDFIDLCNTLHSETLLKLAHKMRLSLPITDEQLLDIISTTNKKVDEKIVVVKEQERIEQEQAEKRRQEELARKAEENYKNKKLLAMGSLVAGIVFSLFTIANFASGEQIGGGFISLIISTICFFASKSFFSEWIALKKQRENTTEGLAKKQEFEEKKKILLAKIKKVLIITFICIVSILVIVLLVLLIDKVIVPNTRYNNAIQSMENGKYEEAIVLFEKVEEYKDSSIKIMECEDALSQIKYNKAMELLDKKQYLEAYEILNDLGSYNDSIIKAKEALYAHANVFYEKGDYDTSNEYFQKLGDYKDSKSKIHTHNYAEKILVVAKCLEKGSKELTCPCGKTKTEEIPATGHAFTNSTITKKATCEGKGEKLLKCRCGETKTESIEATGHKYSSTVTKAVTCDVAGVKTFKCNCGKSYTETISATGHKYSTATCTKGSVCSKCNHTRSGALGHIDDKTNWDKSKDFYLCDRCGYNMVGTLNVSGTIVARNGGGESVSGEKLVHGYLPAGTYRATITVSGNANNLYQWDYDVTPKNAGLNSMQVIDLQFKEGTVIKTFTITEPSRDWFYSNYPCTYSIKIETLK